MGERVVILGASNNETRYAYKAMALLIENGHEVVPVTPRAATVQGIPTVPDLGAVAGPVDTVTIYVRPDLLAPQIDALVALSPKRVIFNPGTEDDGVMQRVKDAGVAVVEACTIVMQKTGQF